MRTFRHPGVIKVFDTVETESYIYLATERVIPLEWSVRRKALSEETCKWGLYTVANTVAFINDEASSVHGNVRLSSIFMSGSGEWKMGGFEILSSVKDDEAVIYRYGGSMREADRYAPREVVTSGWETIKKNPISAVDSYGFGLLLLEVFSGRFVSSDQIGVTKHIPPTMHQSYRRLLNSNPRARVSVSHFCEQGMRAGGFFQTPLIRLSEAIGSLGLKSDREREELLSELDQVANDFPEEFFTVKVLPELLKSVEFGGGGSKVFATCMKIGKKLSDDEWDSKLIPVIIRLFANPDRAVRIFLLDSLPDMIDHLSQKTVNDKIFPQMVTGFTDVAPLVREQTVKSILIIITKLADRTVNGELLKYLAKTSNDEQPGIRTNTTICMGKLARSLSAGTRQKVLIAAFSRSLRDPFVHARNAALMALAATADLFSDDDCAFRILPALCPLLVDKEKIVRDQANKTFDIFVQGVRKHAMTLSDTVSPAPAAAIAGGVTRVGSSQTDAAVAGWTGWAISSFTNKISTVGGDIQPGNLCLQPPKLNRSISVPPATDTGLQHVNRPSSKAISQQANQKPSKEASRSSIGPDTPESIGQEDDIDEAWGDMNGESFFDAPLDAVNDPEPKSVPVSFNDGGEPDFEGWLTAQKQIKQQSKSSIVSRSSAKIQSRQGVVRTTTTGSVGQSAGLKKLANTAPKSGLVVSKQSSLSSKEAEDDWGDAWQ